MSRTTVLVLAGLSVVWIIAELLELAPARALNGIALAVLSATLLVGGLIGRERLAT